MSDQVSRVVTGCREIMSRDDQSVEECAIDLRIELFREAAVGHPIGNDRYDQPFNLGYVASCLVTGLRRQRVEVDQRRGVAGGQLLQPSS